ncbi:MAG: aromatic amino acid hydroxylase [Bacteroidales bacterium]
MIETNEILEQLPRHLKSYIIDQPYESYTPRDQAVWRYVMRQNLRYLPQVAHSSYLEGLTKTGISIEEIPRMYGMNRILGKIGWAAVAVDGFLPPSVFMEFQAWKVLVIAADIRTAEQIEYTPAPDIIHEAAGHAPIIADPQYADYLQLFGKIGARAFSSAHDYSIYEAIRHLSILKADPNTPARNIAAAEKELARLQSTLMSQSEMARIRNLHWWTVEYGLIGELDNPKIYGAGLLSSIGESKSALKPEVKKIPFTIDAVHYDFDITKPQPQLFVTPDFERLTDVLNQFADTMALRVGGVYGLQKALESESLSTVVYSSGLQVSGIVDHFLTDEKGNPIWFHMQGPVALSFNEKHIPGHGPDYHADGFSSPVGQLKGTYTPLEDFKDNDLKRRSIEPGKEVEMEFDSGITVKGRLQRVYRENAKILYMSLSDCLVRYRDKVLFKPSWGVFDMAVGAQIVSAFQGAASPDEYGIEVLPPAEKTHKIVYSKNELALHDLYAEIREARENEKETDLEKIFDQVESKYPEEWLLPLEIMELCKAQKNQVLFDRIYDYLSALKTEKPGLENVITDGLDALVQQSAITAEKP